MIRFLFDGIYIFPTNGDPWRLLAYYGIILMLGAVAGAWLAAREVKRRGARSEIVWDLVGLSHHRRRDRRSPVARFHPAALLHRAGHHHGLLPDPSARSDQSAKGRVGDPGAVIGGAIALYFYSRKHKMSFAEWADIAAPSAGPRPGHWAVGQLLQPGTLRRSHRPAVENLH